MLQPVKKKDKKSALCYSFFMFQITGLDFTRSPDLFVALQNKGKEFLMQSGRRLMKSVRFPFVVIVTCDRAEVIAEKTVPHESFERSLLLNPLAVASSRYAMEDDGRHLFLLSSGILSPLFGEDTIQGQLREAAEAACLIGSSSSRLDKLFNMAVAFSKRMHTEHKMRVFDTTIADEIVRRCDGKDNILIVGSGEMARALAERLVSSHRVIMTLRDEKKTFLVPPGVLPVAYEKRGEYAASSDVVISASSGLYHTFSLSEIERLEGKLIFDLSSPPDLPSSPIVQRIPDLGVEEPEKENVIAIVTREAEKEIGDYNGWLEKALSFGDLSAEAEDVAYESLRRLSGAISSLRLDEDAENRLRTSIADSVRKAFIAKFLQKKKS